MLPKLNLAFLRQEARTLLLNPSTPVFLGFAWVAAALAAFYAGGFFMANEANANALFGFLPWVFVFVLPALTMGLWAEDWRKGTAERMFTLPITPLSLSLTRFAALWLLVGLFLLGTWPFMATLFWLGNPAVGPLLSGYLGAWLLGGALLSGCLLVSAASRSFVVAFVGGLALCLMLLFSGWAAGLAWLSNHASPVVVNALREASLMEHYRTFILGQVNLRSVVYMLAVMVFFQTATYLVLARRLDLVRGAAARAITAVLLVAALATAAVAMQIPGRLDLTADKLYTLAPQTKALLRQLPPGSEVIVYSSEANPDVPAPTRRLARRLNDLLVDFKRAAGGNFSYRTINVDKGIPQELAAVEDGIREQATRMGDGFYFGLAMHAAGRKVVMPTLEPEREPYLEFDLASLLAEVVKTERKSLAVLAVPELSGGNSRPQFLRELENFYHITYIQPGAPEIPQQYNALIILPAPYYPQETLYAVNRYLLGGGRVMAFLDPYYRTVPETMPNLPDRNADDFADDHMADLLRGYGITYAGEEVVLDTFLASPIQEEKVGYTTYPFWITLGADNINRSMPFASFVTDVTLAEGGHFVVDPAKVPAGLVVEPVLTTSPEAQVAARAMLDTLDAQTVAPQVKSPRGTRIMALLATGTFPNLYRQAPAAVQQYYADYTPQGESVQLPALPDTGSRAGALVVFGDIDFADATFAFRNVTGPDGRPMPQAANDNLVLLFNTLQWLTGEGELLGLRGKGVSPRTFTRVEKILQQKAVAARRAEQRLAAELYEVSQRLATIKARAGNATEINALAAEELKTYASREFALKANLRQIRRELRNDISRMGHVLALVNALAMPLLLLAGYAFFRHARRKRSLKVAQQ